PEPKVNASKGVNLDLPHLIDLAELGRDENTVFATRLACLRPVVNLRGRPVLACHRHGGKMLAPTSARATAAPHIGCSAEIESLRLEAQQTTLRVNRREGRGVDLAVRTVL